MNKDARIIAGYVPIYLRQISRAFGSTLADYSVPLSLSLIEVERYAYV